MTTGMSLPEGVVVWYVVALKLPPLTIVLRLASNMLIVTGSEEQEW